MTDATATRPATAKHQLVDDRLRQRAGVGLDTFYREARRLKRSRRLIAADIAHRTGVDLTEATLRNWYPEPKTTQETP